MSLEGITKGVTYYKFCTQFLLFLRMGDFLCRPLDITRIKACLKEGRVTLTFSHMIAC